MTEFKRMSVMYSNLRKGDVVVTPERATVWVDRPLPEKSEVVLPTKPNTVIAPVWKDGQFGGGKLYRDDLGEWFVIGGSNHYDTSTLASRITGFKIVVEPSDERTDTISDDAEDSITRRIREVKEDTVKAVIQAFETFGTVGRWQPDGDTISWQPYGDTVKRVRDKFGL